jgi:uncharacterized protein YggE
MSPNTRKLRNSATVALAAGAVGVLLVRLARPTRPVAAPPSGERTITVVGTGTASQPPDQARVQMGVRATASSAQEATRQGAEAMTKVIALLKGRGAADKHIQTGYFSITPEYDHRGNGPPKRTGHTATNSVNVTLTDLNAVGGMLDAVVGAGGDLITINNIQLSASNPQPAQDEARRNALRDARRQAELIAQEMGVTLGAPLAIQPTGGHMPMPQPRMAMRAMAAMSAESPIEAGEMEVAVAMDVMFAIV